MKLHRVISQSPAKAAAKRTLLDRLLASTRPLVEANRLAAFLLVLPPSFAPPKRSLDELDTLAEALSPTPLAVELRHGSWVRGTQKKATLDYFRERGLVWVSVDMPRIPGSSLMPVVDEVTRADLAYVRLHGRNPGYVEAETAAEGHHYAYTPREVTSLAARVRRLAKTAAQVIVVANNHSADFAPKTALAVQARLAGD